MLSPRRELYRRALGLPEVEQVEIVFPNGGSMLYLDGGTLDLGIVRGSTLEGGYDFQIFGETFEHVARITPKSLRQAPG